MTARRAKKVNPIPNAVHPKKGATLEPCNRAEADPLPMLGRDAGRARRRCHAAGQGLDAAGRSSKATEEQADPLPLGACRDG